MSRQQRIELLRQVMQERGDEASKALAHRRQLLDEANDRLSQLQGYRQEYASAMVAGSPGLGVQLLDHWRFLSRLNHAIEEHRQRIEQHSVAVEQSFERWRDSQREVAVLQKVVERIRASERQAAERREQRLLDELAGAASGLARFEED